MSDVLTTYFNRYAESALDQIHHGLAAIDFYGEVIDRLKNGIDISDSVPEVKRVGSKIALDTAQEILADYIKRVEHIWDLPKPLKEIATTKISKNKERLENLPRYDVTHTFKLESGKINILISTANRNHRLEIDTDRNTMKAAATIHELEQYLTLAAISA
jgi:hypothetical protein